MFKRQSNTYIDPNRARSQSFNAKPTAWSAPEQTAAPTQATVAAYANSNAYAFPNAYATSFQNTQNSVYRNAMGTMYGGQGYATQGRAQGQVHSQIPSQGQNYRTQRFQQNPAGQYRPNKPAQYQAELQKTIF